MNFVLTKIKYLICPC